MKLKSQIPAIGLALGLVAGLPAATPAPGESPADHLPPHIRQVTWFGERADWSHDGKRILFLSKTFGDAMELDLATKAIRNRTAHYFLRRAYEPVLVSFEKTPDRINVWVINDSPQPVSGTLVVQRLDFNGKVLGKLQVDVAVKSGEARRCLNATPLGEISLRSEFLHAALAGRESICLLIGERYLHLPTARLAARLADGRIEIETDQFAREVALEFEAVTGAVFEDNFFDLAPGRKRTIAVRKAAGGTALTVRALNAEPIRLVWKP